jgi:hypothetical protein
MCLGSRNLLICRFLCPSSILARYLSVVPDIRPFRPTPSLLSTTPELVLPWQWDLCAPSLKCDPHRFRFIIDREDFFPAELIWEDFLCTFLWLAPHDPVMRHDSSCIVQPTFLVLIGSPILLQLVLLFPPRRVDLPIPPTEKKERADSAASPSILVALLICCSARNTAHVGDIYPTSSNSSFLLVSFRMVVISNCSWPSQHSCF